MTGETTTASEKILDDAAKEFEEAQKLQMEARKHSHQIAQAAFILTLFAKEDLFARSAGTPFAEALSKLAIEQIVESREIFKT